jgi:hypothetical protein
MLERPVEGVPEPENAAPVPVQICPTCASTPCHCGAALTRDLRRDAQRQRGVR